MKEIAITILLLVAVGALLIKCTRGTFDVCPTCYHAMYTASCPGVQFCPVCDHIESK